MALYLVKSNDPGETTVLVRGRNGDHARELSGYGDGWVCRVTEAGEFGVVQSQMGAPAAEPERKRRKPRQRFLGDPTEPDDPDEE